MATMSTSTTPTVGGNVPVTGTSTTLPKQRKKRPRLDYDAKKANARMRAGKKIVGKEFLSSVEAETAIEAIKNKFADANEDEQERMVLEWTNVTGLTQLEILAIVAIGSTRLSRIKNHLPKKPRGTRAHDKRKLNDEDHEFLKTFVKQNSSHFQKEIIVGEFKIQPGLKCNHQPLQFYLPEGCTFRDLHQVYLNIPGSRQGLSYCHFTTLFHSYYPHIKGTRRTGHECNDCVEDDAVPSKPPKTCTAATQTH